MVEKSITLKTADGTSTIEVDLANPDSPDYDHFEEIFSSASISAGTYLAKNSYILDQNGELTV